MAFDLTIPDPEQTKQTVAIELAVPDPEKTKEEVAQDVAVDEAHAKVIDETAIERGQQIMQVDLDSYEQKREITQAIENLGADIAYKSSAKNEMLARRMKSLGKQGGDTGEVAKSLEDLAIKMRDLDPRGIDFAKGSRAGKLFNPVRRYFERYKTADIVIASIVKSLDTGKDMLHNDNVTLELEEVQMRELTKQLNQQIEIGLDLDAYLSQAIEQAKASGTADPDRIRFVEEEVLFPLRQKITDFQQLQLVNQQGIVSMNVLRRNNSELIRAVDRAEHVTVSALRVAVTVAGALYNQRIVLDKVQALNETTNAMISSTAQMLKEQGTEIQTTAGESNISVETLQQSFADTLQALDDISNYKQAALPRIRQTIDDFYLLAETGEKHLRQIEATTN
ncbi:MAG: toxic anion resistance protein [Eggerthellaceae bacterium]|nr:toxic anion resistance protein [Eggerthellaceae bacterium]